MSVIGPRSNCPSCMVITPALSSIPEPARISALFAASTRYLDGPSAICAMPSDASSTSIIDRRTLPSSRSNRVRASESGPTSASLGPRLRPRSCPRAFAAIAPSWRTNATRSGPATVGACSRSVEDSIASTPTRTTCAAELVSESTERTWRPTNGNTVKGFSRNESPALAASLNSLRAERISSRPSPRISCAGPSSCCAVSSWSRPFWAWRRACTICSAASPHHTTTTTTIAVTISRRRVRRGGFAPAAGALGGLGGLSAASDMGRRFYGLEGQKFGHTSYIATLPAVLTGESLGLSQPVTTVGSWRRMRPPR